MNLYLIRVVNVEKMAGDSLPCVDELIRDIKLVTGEKQFIIDEQEGIMVIEIFNDKIC